MRINAFPRRAQIGKRGSIARGIVAGAVLGAVALAERQVWTRAARRVVGGLACPKGSMQGVVPEFVPVVLQDVAKT